MEQKFLILSRAASALVVVSGGLVMAGWIFGLPSLTAPFGFRPMALITALTFLLTGGGLALCPLGPPGRKQVLFGQVAGGMLIAWGVLWVLLNLNGPPGRPWILISSNLGLIPPATASTFTLFGLAILTFHSRSRPWLGEALASAVGLVGLLFLTGYLYGVPGFHQLTAAMGMRPLCAVNFCLLSIAYLFSRTDVGYMAVFASGTIAGAVARRLLPAAILIPIALGWLHLLSERYHLFSADFGTALLALAVILFFATASAVSIHKLIRLEKFTRTAEAEQARLESLRADVSEILQCPAQAQELLQSVAELLVQRLDAAFARIWTLDATGRILELQASAGQYTHRNGAHSRVLVGEFKIGKIAEERRPHVTNQVLGDPGVHDQAWARRQGMVAFAGFPLMREDRLLGVAALFARHKLSPGEIHVFGSISNLLAQALARKRAELEAAGLKEQLLRANADLEAKVEERTARLVETVRDLEQFSYALSHDLRAPLRAMSGFIHLLLSGQCGSCEEDSAKSLLKRVQMAAERMDALIVDALQYSKALMSEFPLHQVDAREMLQTLIATYPNLEKADIRLEGDFPPVLGYEAALTQCFSNLLGNAVKFVPEGKRPRIKIYPEPKADSVRLWFEDNGIGIAPEYQEKIFHMFQKLNPEYEGTGIGLAIVQKSAQRMGGHVGVESEPGKGSRFWLELKAVRNEGSDLHRPIR